MPDLTGLPALDLAIGLSFIFLLLSLLASAVQEAIAAVLALRAKTLEKGLRNMLEGASGGPTDAVAALYEHPLIRSLYKSGFGPFGKRDGLRRPSYIPPRAFAQALVDTFAPDLTHTGDDGTPKKSRDVIRELREALEKASLPPEVKTGVLKLLDRARGDIDAFRVSLEEWFDDTMARVSGWYKREAQLILAAIAVVVVLLLNANAITIGQRLWEDVGMRTAVVQLAERATAQTPGDTPTEKLENAAKAVDDVKALGVPLGWTADSEDPRYVDVADAQFLYRDLLGWIVTVFAVSLGAPFWFDTLSRFSRLRSSGKPEAPLPASGYGKPGERVGEPAPVVRVELAGRSPDTT